MKSLVFVFNCHGGVMRRQLLSCSEFRKIYNIHVVQIYHYIPERYDKKVFPDNVIKQLNNADVLIVQQMRSDRGWLNTENTIKLVKKKCEIIKIPHYTFSGYWYPYTPVDDSNFDINKSKEELHKYVNNLLMDKPKEIKKFLNDELNHIKELDKLSDIKMYDFVKNNYMKDRLFFSRRYPQSAFFFPMCQGILKILQIKDDMKPQWNGYANKENYPILPAVHKILNFKFRPHMSNRRGIDVPCNIVEYFVIAKQIKRYPFRLGGPVPNKIKDIIKTGRYRLIIA
jgi:hypothetical protein